MAFNGDGEMFLKIKVGDEFLDVKRGVCLLELDLGDRTQTRKFVDGDRCVMMSGRVSVTLEFIREEGDAVQDSLLAAADDGRRIGFICGGAGDVRSMTGAVLVEKVSRGEVFGIKYRVKICS